jgi:hypothetical protein
MPPEPAAEPGEGPPPTPEPGVFPDSQETEKAVEAAAPGTGQPVSPVARRSSGNHDDEAAHALALSLDAEPAQRSGSGFLAGFAAVTLLALVAVTVYVKHAEIAATLPRLEAPLQRYVTVIDDGRVALAEAVARLREAR